MSRRFAVLGGDDPPVRGAGGMAQKKAAPRMRGGNNLVQGFFSLGF